jgi:nicotinamidase-related amidase
MINIPPRLAKHRTVLVVIDLQEKFRDLIAGLPVVTANSSRLIRFCQRLAIPTILTEHYPRGLGVTFPELRELFDRFSSLEKITFSCHGDEGFRAAMAETGRDQAVLCGIESHVCVYQTARDLRATGWQVTVAADAVGSRRVSDHELAVRHLREIGVQVMSTEMILFEILRKAKTDDFQAVADLLKGS